MSERIKTTDDFGFGPAIMDYFSAIPEKAFSYEHFNLRHPGGIYNLVVNRLYVDIAVLADKVTNYDERSVDIYPYFRIVLYDLFKLYDTCFEIMLCFAEPHADKPSPKEFIDKWLSKKGYSFVNDFKNVVDAEMTFLKNLYNKLKHTSNEIRFLTVQHEEITGFGYWLEVANDHGGVGPANDIEFPISLAFEIRRIQYIIYKLSDALFDVIKTHVAIYFPNDNYNVSLRDPQDVMFAHLNDVITGYPDFFLLNEKNKEFYKGEFIEDGNKNYIEFTKNIITEDILNKYYAHKVSGGYVNSGDGYTREFSMPHMGIINKKDDFIFVDRTENTPRLL